MKYNKNPESIEEQSFKIIGEEGKEMLSKYSPEELMIIKRIIHTTADFEYGEITEIHPKAIEVAKKAFLSGSHIYADTSMIVNGVRRKKLEELNIEIHNFVHDDDIYKIALEEGITRSMAGIKKAAKDDKIDIFMIGNAPTAIFQLKELIDAGYKKPKLIIGTPVGFVGAAESKELLSEMDIPYIRVNGRKGGSAVAVSIANAILKMI
jgi:precorrin-8X/cobalt-precorrin-8 methylmutase